jgi:transposase
MKWAKGIAAAVALTLGVFVAAIPAASIEPRAHAAPFATDADDDDLAQQAVQQSLQQMEESEQEAEQQNEAAQQQTQLDEQLAQTDQQPGQ